MIFSQEISNYNCGYLSFYNDEVFSVESYNSFFNNIFNSLDNLKSNLIPNSYTELKRKIEKALNENEINFSQVLVFVCKKRFYWLQCNFSFGENKIEDKINKITCIGIDISDLKRKQINTNYEKDILNLALKNAATDVWKYDLKTKTLTLVSATAKQTYGIEKIENVPEIFVENEYIHPDSLFPFLEMHEAIQRGEPISEADIRVKISSGEYKWIRMKYVMSYDTEKGSPVAAIGTGKDITSEKEIQLRTLLDIQYKEAIMSDALCVIETNLSKNLILNSDSRLKDLLKSNFSMSYSGLLNGVMENVILEEDRNLFKKQLSREKLIDLFKTGKKKFGFEYRIGGDSYSAYWIRIYINFILEPMQGDVCALVYVKNITDKKMKEVKLRTKAERDSLSNLYNRATTEKKINYELDILPQDTISVLYMIDLDNFKQINDYYGHLSGDTVICEISNRIKRIFRDSDIISRLGGDEFSVFLSNVPSYDFIEKKAQQICETINLPILLENISKSVSCSVGIAVSPNDGTCFEDLYNSADKALYNAKSKGKNQYSLNKE